MKIKRAVARTIYEAIARHLPCSHAPVNIGQEKLRRWCVTNFCGGGADRQEYRYRQGSTDFIEGLYRK